MAIKAPAPQKWILIRGLMRSRFHWKSFGEELKIKLGLESVQELELPGNGFLSNEVTPALIEQAVASLRRQLQSSNSESYGIIGISLGGMIATKWAQLHPGEVSHLVLINSSSGRSRFYARLLPRNYFSIFWHLVISAPDAIEEFILRTTSNNEKIWREHLDANIDFLKKHPLKISNFLRQLKLSGQTNFSLKPLSKKLILTSKTDRLVSFTCSEKIAAHWGCQIFCHESAGHDLPLDDSAWVIERIRAFTC